MRPLLVLVLVIAAAAALTFTLFKLSDSGSGSTRTTVDVPSPVAPRTGPTDAQQASIDAPEDVPIETLEPVADGGRSEVEQGAGAYTNRLSGTVRDPQGRARPGTTVVLSKDTVPSQLDSLQALLGGGKEKSGPKWTTKTDEKGEYSIRGIDPGTGYTLVALHDEFSPGEVPYLEIPLEGEVVEDIRLQQGVMLHGYVRDDLTSMPIADATVTFETMPFRAVGRPVVDPGKREVKTDAAGYFRILNATAGSRTVTAEAEGYGTKSKVNLQVPAAKESVECDFRMEQAKIIAGRIVGPDQAGIVGATIEAMSYSTDESSRGTAVSVAGGEFIVEGLATGAYVLVVRAEGFGEERLNRVEAETLDVLVQMAEQGAVQGKVVDASNGRPIRDFHLRVRYVNDASSTYGRAVATQSFKNKKDGSYEVGGIEQGTYALQVASEGYAPTFSENFDITQGITTPDVVVRMTRGGRIVGRVLDAKTNEPIGGVKISTNENNWIRSPFTDMLGSMMPRNATSRSTRTNAQGVFELEKLTPFPYQIEIEHPNFTKETRNDIQVQAGQDVDIGTIKLRPGGVLRGTVYDAAGRPLSGASVTLTSTDRSGLTYTVRASKEGRYVLKHAAEGNYNLSATKPSTGNTGNPFDVLIDMKNSEVELTVVDGSDQQQDLYLGG